MKIAAITVFVAMAALAGCSRSDKTATPEPVGTTTVTSAPLTLSTPDEEELDRRERYAIDALLARPVFMNGDAERPVDERPASRVMRIMDTLDDLSLGRFSSVEGDDRTLFHVQMALMLDADFLENTSDVDVHVDRGVVTLTGTSTTPAARASVERIAMQQSGVARVDNRLRIGPMRAPASHERR